MELVIHSVSATLGPEELVVSSFPLSNDNTIIHFMTTFSCLRRGSRLLNASKIPTATAATQLGLFKALRLHVQFDFDGNSLTLRA